VQAIVLVGGEGTRLRPLTYGTPKPMVPIVNVPFLARTMERLRDAGITDVILPAGYLPQAIIDYFGDGSDLGMRITYVIEETPLGTAGALKNVEEHITGPFFVLNGDVLTSLDLRAMMHAHQQTGGIGTLHLIRVEDPSAFGCVVHDASGRISAFIEKPPAGQAPTNAVNAGTYLLEREILAMIPAGRPVSIERETFPNVIAAGKALYAYTTSDYWIDLGRPDHYLKAHRDVLCGTMPLGVAATQGSGLIAPVVLADDVFVDPTARVGPNVVLGAGTRVGAGAVIRDSVLWENVDVGDGAQIDESIVASGTTIGAGAHIGRGSVIGHGQIIEPGATIAEESRVGGPRAVASP
jgi:mannose-1-phosphate guanylyltransferase